ncbi:3-oxoacyl-ACP reductase [Arthrobacter sp. Leaf234]|uniref:3-oxoacyl-ACP reductase n=1 Tax=Arthrobacter sp. Leaf234 TaxID=1736303 RepID=UPI0012F7600B|nr:3-oxoacyl-ACP reductase [Arthrobacter sp. Leaf234]
MGLDDANTGGPGECPGHEFVLSGIQLRARGASMTQQCRYCGAVSYTPSRQD